LNTPQPHHHVHWAIHGADNSGNVAFGGKTGRVQDIGTRFLIRLQALDRVPQIGLAAQVVLRTRRQRERKWKGTRRRHCGADSLNGMFPFIDRMVWASGRILD